MDDYKHEKPRNLIPRRQLLRNAALLTGGAASGLAVNFVPINALAQNQPAMASPVASPEVVATAALTADELETVKAIVDRIIPSIDQTPGAADAGAHLYIDGALKSFAAASLPLYQLLLPLLDDAAGGNGFVAAPVEKQDEILAELADGKLEGAPEGAFFTLLSHTRQGTFSDPIYGGNVDQLGWKLIKYPGVKLLWTVGDQSIDAEIEPTHQTVTDFGRSQP